jgi:hypothetical protein
MITLETFDGTTVATFPEKIVLRRIKLTDAYDKYQYDNLCTPRSFNSVDESFNHCQMTGYLCEVYMSEFCFLLKESFEDSKKRIEDFVKELEDES